MKQLHKQNDLSNAYRNEAKLFVAVFGTGKIYLPITPIYVRLYQRVSDTESITYTIEKNRNFMIKFLDISNKSIIFVSS